MIVGGKIRHINPISAPVHGIKIAGNISSCLPSPKSLPNADNVTLDGPFIPGKNGRIPPVKVSQSTDSKVLLPNIGLPRGSGFCACWLRGKHCSKDRLAAGSRLTDVNTRFGMPLKSQLYCLPVSGKKLCEN